jgi:flagellar biosynthesis GTPase FlhF
MVRFVWKFRFAALVTAPLLLTAQDVAPRVATKPPSEIVVPSDDGTFTLRDIQFVGSFRAAAVNGLKHDWDFPVFTIECEGHPSPDKKDRESLTVKGNCSWPVGHTCSLFSVSNFSKFFPESCTASLTDGQKIPTKAELDAEARRKQAAAREEARQALEEDRKYWDELARQKRLAAERKKAAAEAKAKQDAAEAEERARARAACEVVYRETADTKLKDLTVRQEQQVRACQALGLYPPH